MHWDTCMYVKRSSPRKYKHFGWKAPYLFRSNMLIEICSSTVVFSRCPWRQARVFQANGCLSMGKRFLKQGIYLWTLVSERFVASCRLSFVCRRPVMPRRGHIQIGVFKQKRMSLNIALLHRIAWDISTGLRHCTFFCRISVRKCGHFWSWLSVQSKLWT